MRYVAGKIDAAEYAGSDAMRTLARLIVFFIVLIVAAAFFFGYRWGSLPAFSRPAVTEARPVEERPVATTGRDDSRREHARETGAAVGAKLGDTAARAGHALEEGSLTAKIKSKIALDDTLKGTSISVHTNDDVVTLSGDVATSAQHARVLQLARETNGVSRVVDQLAVRSR